MKEKLFENLQFATLVLLIVGQCTISSNFYFGQVAYLVANVISVARCFVLGRPLSDKVKDVACTGITLGLILIKVFRGL